MASVGSFFQIVRLICLLLISGTLRTSILTNQTIYKQFYFVVTQKLLHTTQDHARIFFNRKLALRLASFTSCCLAFCGRPTGGILAGARMSGTRGRRRRPAVTTYYPPSRRRACAKARLAPGDIVLKLDVRASQNLQNSVCRIIKFFS